MKKLFIAVLLLVAVTFAACQSDDNNANSTGNNTEVNDTETNVNDNADENDNANNQVNDDEENTENSNAEENDSEGTNEDEDDNSVDQKPEYETIQSEVDLDNMTPDVVEDNQSKRIILFRDDNNRESYKTIFIKDDNKLKIIDIKDDEGQIYYGEIE